MKENQKKMNEKRLEIKEGKRNENLKRKERKKCENQKQKGFERN